MFQLIALFKQPVDSAAFDKAYWETHIPLAKQIPGVASLEVSKFHPAKDGPAPYYQIAILTWPDKDSFKAAMKSAENAAAGMNLMGFAGNIVEFSTAEKVNS